MVLLRYLRTRIMWIKLDFYNLFNQKYVGSYYDSDVVVTQYTNSWFTNIKSVDLYLKAKMQRKNGNMPYQQTNNGACCNFGASIWMVTMKQDLWAPIITARWPVMDEFERIRLKGRFCVGPWADRKLLFSSHGNMENCVVFTRLVFTLFFGCTSYYSSYRWRGDTVQRVYT